MLSLSKRRIIKSALKFKYSDSPRITWWLADESLIPVVQSIVGVVRDITNNAVPTNIKVLKLNKRKAVFSMEHPQDCGQSFFAKVFFLNRLEHKFKYHKYGLDEAANLLRARDRGINTPRVPPAMIAPIMDPSGCFGVLYVDNAGEKQYYTLSDLDYLMLLAIHAAAIVETF